MKNDLVENFNIPLNRAFVVYNPVDVSRIRYEASYGINRHVWRAGEDLSIIAVGRLVNQKGFDILFDALSNCLDISFSVRVFGDGPERLNLLRQVDRLGFGDRVKLIPFSEDIYREIFRSDLLIVTSRYEGLPNVVLESLALGTPCIVSPSCVGLLEILGNRHGCTVACGESSLDFARTIRGWHCFPNSEVPDDAVLFLDTTVVSKNYLDVLNYVLSNK